MDNATTAGGPDPAGPLREQGLEAAPNNFKPSRRTK